MSERNQTRAIFLPWLAIELVAAVRAYQYWRANPNEA